MAAAWVDVRLIGLPVPLWADAQEQYEELRREFALVSVGRNGSVDGTDDVPSRLVELVEDLSERLQAMSGAHRAELAAAALAGTPSVDITYRLPVAGLPQIVEMLAIMRETDDFCRDGHHLLTLAMPPRLARFRDWYLGEIIGQLSGADPQPWVT